MNLTEQLPGLNPGHYLNKGDGLTRTYHRIEDQLWARRRGVPAFSHDLDGVNGYVLHRLINRAVVDMAQAAMAGGVIDNAGNSTALEIFTAYQQLDTTKESQ